MPKATVIGPGFGLIAEERTRQVVEEGWTAEHDDQHKNCELLSAVLCYLGMAASLSDDTDAGAELRDGLLRDWPWAPKWWKPSIDPVRNLVKAGALIAAEIDRILREEEKRDA